MGHLERGVVDQDVDAAETFDRLFHQCPAMHLVRQVPRQQQALAAGLFNPARGFLRILLLIQIRHGYVGTFTGKGDGHRPANAAVAPGDQGDLAIQATRTFVALLTAVWIGIHFALGAGDGLLLFGEGWFGVVVHCRSPVSR
ncbi:hypothetical protein D3C78_1439960 [compost metagenome]